MRSPLEYLACGNTFLWLQVCLCFITISAESAFSSDALTLEACYQAALKRSETLAETTELIDQAEERLKQARGSLLATISGTLAHLVQPPPQGATANNFFPANQTTIRLTAIQPVFRGLREFAAIRQRSKEVDAFEYEKNQAATLLFEDVVQNFYQVLTFEKDIQNLNTEIKLLTERVKELERYRKIGRARRAEVLSLKSTLASVEAQLQAVKGEIEVAKESLSFLTGFSVHDAHFRDELGIPQSTQPVQDYLNKIEQRPDIRALAEKLEASESAINIIRGAHLPSADVRGDYFFARPGALSGVNWALQFELTVPIFQGGVIQSQVRETTSIAKQAELQLSRARRQAKQQIESLYFLTQSNTLQLKRQDQAVQLSKETYTSELNDYRFGLVTNLEVLQALSLFQSNQRTLDRNIFQTKADYLRLLSASAMINRQDSLPEKVN